jgi:hypothetical protein
VHFAIREQMKNKLKHMKRAMRKLFSHNLSQFIGREMTLIASYMWPLKEKL